MVPGMFTRYQASIPAKVYQAGKVRYFGMVPGMYTRYHTSIPAKVYQAGIG